MFKKFRYNQYHFYCQQQSSGKVIFSEACVKGPRGGGACVAGGMCGGGRAWQGACMTRVGWQGALCGRGGMRGGRAWHVHPHLPRTPPSVHSNSMFVLKLHIET